jgi:hypothetical protein
MVRNSAPVREDRIRTVEKAWASCKNFGGRRGVSAIWSVRIDKDPRAWVERFQKVLK